MTTATARRKLSTLPTDHEKAAAIVRAYSDEQSKDRDLICNFGAMAHKDIDALKAIVEEAGVVNALVDLVVALCFEAVRNGCDILTIKDDLGLGGDEDRGEDEDQMSYRLRRLEDIQARMSDLLDRIEAVTLPDPDDEDEEQPESD
jgi:hypothetical protein